MTTNSVFVIGMIMGAVTAVQIIQIIADIRESLKRGRLNQWLRIGRRESSG